MKKTECPLLDKCPIFIHNVFHNEIIGITYKNLYCITIHEEFKKCKRFLFVEKHLTNPPDSVLPNSKLSLEEIANKMGI